MPDPKSSLWQVPDNTVPLTPSEQAMAQSTSAPAMPDAAGVAKVMPDLTKTIAGAAASPNYAALKGGSTEQPSYDTRKAIISSFPGISQLLGAKPEEVAEAKQWRQANDAANLANAEKVISENKPYGNAVSATQGLVSGATMGAPEALQKMLGPGNGQETTQQVKQQYPIANIAGNVAGALGSSFALPGAGTALAAKGGMLAGKGLMPLVAKEALNAATFAIPTAVTQGIASGDPGATWQDLKQNMLYGTIGGVAIGKIIGGSGKIAKAMDEVANDMAINSAIPGASRILKNVAGGGVAGKVGATAEHVAELKSNLADMIIKNGLGSKADVEAFTEGNGKLWNAVDEGFKNSGAKPSDFLPEIMQHPDIAKMLNDPQYGAEVQTYIQNTLKRGDALTAYAGQKGESALPDIRKILNTDMKNGFKSSDVGTQLKADVADAIHDVIDGHFVPAELKQTWPAMKMLKAGAMRAESNIRGVEAGSPTAPRMILEKMLGGGEGGALAGGAMGLRDFDPSDPSSWAKLGLNMTIGTVAGSMANKGFARLANKMGGKTAGALKGLASIIPQGSADAGSVAAKFLGSGAAGGMLPSIGGIAGGPTMAPGPAMGQAAPPEQAPAGAPATIPMQPIPNAPAQPPQPTPAQAMSNANDAMVHAADPARNVPGFNPTAMQERLQEWYQVHTRRMGNDLSFDDFSKQLAQATGGFSPDNPLTYKIMVDDPSEAERLFKAHMTLKKLDGVQLEDAINYYRQPWNRWGGTRNALGGDVGRAQDMAHTKLVDALQGMGLGDVKGIEARLKKIAWNDKLIAGKGEGAKQAIVDWMTSQGGIPIQQLMDLGLWH